MSIGTIILIILIIALLGGFSGIGGGPFYGTGYYGGGGLGLIIVILLILLLLGSCKRYRQSDRLSSPAQAGDPVFAETLLEPRSRGVLDAPHTRGMTTDACPLHSLSPPASSSPA